jgi:hypothetical protein
MSMVEKNISGGQTGADRAALDVALELKIRCGAWCPKGRRAEDAQRQKKKRPQRTLAIWLFPDHRSPPGGNPPLFCP